MRHGMGVFALLAISIGSAHAQAVSDEFGIERFRVAMDRSGLIDVDGAGVPSHGSWSLAAWAGFAHEPLVVYDNAMQPVAALVEHRLTTGLVGSYGLWNRLELAVALDLVGHQTGSSAPPAMSSLPATGLGDARLAAKLQLAGDARFQLAVIPTLVVPAGDAGGFLREAGPTFAP